MLDVATHRYLCNLVGLRSVKQAVEEVKGHRRNSQSSWKCGTTERVERSENTMSWTGAMGTRELDVDELSRVTDLMFLCGLTFTVKSRKAERACVNMTSILICWTRVSRS